MVVFINTTEDVLMAKCVAIFETLNDEDGINILNKVVESITIAQNTLFSDYVTRHDVEFKDHRSLSSIKKKKIEYIGGTDDVNSFYISFNYPKIESPSMSISLWDSSDYIYTDIMGIRLFFSDKAYGIEPVCANSRLVGIESSHSNDATKMVNKIMYIIKRPYQFNPNLTSTVFTNISPWR